MKKIIILISIILAIFLLFTARTPDRMSRTTYKKDLEALKLADDYISSNTDAETTIAELENIY